MSEFLMHHGIKGQKWGEKNGPPYPLSGNQKSYAEKKEEKDFTVSFGGSRKDNKKKKENIKKLSDDELAKRIERLNMEENYLNLQKRVKDKDTSTIKKIANAALESLMKTSSDWAMKWAVKKVINSLDPDAVLQEEVDHLRLENEKNKLKQELSNRKKNNQNKSLQDEVDRLKLESERNELKRKISNPTKKDPNKSLKDEINRMKLENEKNKLANDAENADLNQKVETAKLWVEFYKLSKKLSDKPDS